MTLDKTRTIREGGDLPVEIVVVEDRDTLAIGVVGVIEAVCTRKEDVALNAPEAEDIMMVTDNLKNMMKVITIIIILR
jgi:stage III sporulation protein SpoIIIAA